MDSGAHEGTKNESGGFASANPFEDAAAGASVPAAPAAPDAAAPAAPSRELDDHALMPAGSGLASGMDDFFSPSPPGSPPQTAQAQPAVPVNGTAPAENGSAASYSAGPTPSASKVVDRSILDKLNADIAKRTAAIDTATKQKEAEILAAAKQFLQNQIAQREKEVSTAKAERRKVQQENEQQIDGYLKKGALWSAVSMMVDLKKPNNYAKGTETMRSLLTKLSEEAQPEQASPAQPATQ